MKKIIGFLILIAAVLAFATAGAELSTNLQVKVEMNPNNRNLVARRTFVDEEGNPVVPEDKGYATIRYTYGTRNVVKQTEFLDEKGNRVDCVDGYCVKACSYSGTKLTKTAYFDAAGNPAIGPEGYAVQEIKLNLKGYHVSTWEYDTKGNPVNLHRITEYVGGNLPNKVRSDSWYDTEDNLATGPEGYARVEYKYSGKNLSRTAYYSADGNLYYNAKAKFAVKEEKYDNGKARELCYYGADGELMAGPDGYARATYQYFSSDGKTGNEKLTMFYNADDSLFFTKKGYCGFRRKLGKGNRVTEESYYTGEGVRGYSTDGYSKVTTDYTQRGKIYIQRFYDAEDQLMYVPEKGYAMIKNTYANRQLVKVEYFDEAKELTKGPDGYAVAVNRYEKKTYKVETVFYDDDGKTMIPCKDGYARVKYKYNDKKKVISETYFDAEGNPAIVHDNADEIRFTWNGNNKTSESYWQDGKPVNGEKGYHELAMEYTGSNKVSTRSFLDAEGNPVVSTDGYARMETLYNSKDAGMATLYYNENGELINTPGQAYAYVLTITQKERDILSGAATAEPEEEEAEGEAEEEEEEAAEEPEEDEEEEDVTPSVSEKAEEEEKDPTGIVYVEYYDTNRELMNIAAGYAYIVRETDDKGRKTSEIYYDTQGQKVTLADGYNEIRWEYEGDFTTARREAYFLDGEPVAANGSGAAAIEREFNKSGSAVRERTLGANGEPVIRKNETYDEVRTTYNDKNQAVRIDYLAGGEPVLTAGGGIAAILREYDEKGLVNKEWYLGTGNEPLIHKGNKYAKIERNWLDNKHILSEAWFDTDGQPMTIGDTYVRIGRQFDPVTLNTMSEKTYSADGNPIARNDGYDEIRYEYNEKNQTVRIGYFLSGEPVLTNGGGIAAICREYDEKGLVSREWYVDTADWPVIHKGNKYARIDRTWLDGRHVTSEAWFDTDGQPMTIGNTFVKIERTFDDKLNTISEQTYGPDGKAIARNEGYDETQYQYNEKNQTTRIIYLLNGELVLTNNEIAVICRDYDEKGLVNREWYLGTDGAPAIHKGNKYARIDRTWLDSKHVSSEAWFDTDGQPMTIGDTFVKIERAFDERLNTISEKTFGADGNPIARNDGYDEVRTEYNDKNQAIRIGYFLNGEPVLTVSGGIAVICREYDEKGLVSREWYLGTAEEPVIHTKNKYAKIEQTWLDSKHATSESWFDTDGNAMTLGDTFVRVERAFDDRLNTISEKTFGEDGNPIARKDGYDEVRTEYNDKNQAVRIDYSLNGEPVLTAGGGIAAICREYDEKGLVSREWYLGTGNEPVIHKGNKYAKIERTWLDSKHATSEAWFDTDGNAMTLGDTFVKIERAFDERLNTISEKTYGADGNPIARKDGYDEVRTEYNDKNQAVRIAYFLGGEPVLTNGGGIAVILREYDEKGLVSREWYLGTAEEPVFHKSSKYAKIERTWLDSKHATSEAWFDTDGNAMTLGDTFVKVERAFDERLNTISEKTYGADGNPIARNDGYDEVRTEYNEKNQAVRIAYFLNGEPVLTNGGGIAVICREYDDKGLVSREWYLGTAEEPVIHTKNKYARIDRTWLDNKHATSEAWFDTDGQPMTVGNTFVKVVREFDEKTLNTRSEEYYGADGNPIARSEGYDEIWYQYNEKNQIVRFEYYLGGEPVLLGGGYAAMEREYDAAGNVSYEKYYDTAFEPTPCRSGWGAIRKEYNEKKQVIHEQWYDAAGEAMTYPGDVYYGIRREYDENGLANVLKFFDESDQPMKCKDGYEMVWRRFNEKKQVNYETYMDQTGTLTANTKGVYQTAYDYDEQGRVIREVYFDAEGKEMASTEGFKILEWEFDEGGQKINVHGIKLGE